MNTESFVFMGIIFFLGLSFGWCFKSPFSIWRIVLALVGLSVVGPVLDFMILADSIYMTGPFLLGFLVHTAKPIYLRLRN